MHKLARILRSEVGKIFRDDQPLLALISIADFDSRRRDDAFSELVDIRLVVGWYNLGRIHQTLRVTPAMETGHKSCLEFGGIGGMLGPGEAGSGGMNTKGFVWWKMVFGAVLVLIETKQLLNPGSRAFHPSNATQAASMLTVEYAVLLLGAWLIFSGLRAKYKS